MCESLHCPAEQWLLFSCLIFKFIRRLQANKLWLTTQNWPSNVAQVQKSPHNQFFRIHWQPFPTSTNTICWIWLIFEDTGDQFLFCFMLISIDLWFVACADLRNFFWSIVFLHFFAPIDISFFWANCAESKMNKCFLRPDVHATSNICWSMTLPHGMSHDVLALSVLLTVSNRNSEVAKRDQLCVW